MDTLWSVKQNDNGVSVLIDGIWWDMDKQEDNLFSITCGEDTWLYNFATDQWEKLMSDDDECNLEAWDNASSAPSQTWIESLDRKEPVDKFHATGPITRLEWDPYVVFVSMALVRCWPRAQWLILSALQTCVTIPRLNFHKPGFLHVWWEKMLFAFDVSATIFMWHQNKWWHVDANCIQLISDVPCLVLQNGTILVVGPSARATIVSNERLVQNIVFDCNETLFRHTMPSYDWIHTRFEEEASERIAVERLDEKKKHLATENEAAIHNELRVRENAQRKLMEGFAAQLEKEKAAQKTAEKKAAREAEVHQFIEVGVSTMDFKPSLTHQPGMMHIIKFPDGTTANWKLQYTMHNDIMSFYAIHVNGHWLPILNVSGRKNEMYFIFILAMGIVCTSDIHDGTWRPMSAADYEDADVDAKFVRDFYTGLSGKYTPATVEIY